MTARTWSKPAIAGWAATLALFVAGGALSPWSGSTLGDVLDAVGVAALMIAISTLGVLITRREEGNPIGWLFVIAPLSVAASVAGGTYTEWAQRHTAAPGGAAAGWLSNWAWPCGLLACALLVPLLFPDGRPPARRWLLLLRADLVALAVLAVVLMTQPGEVQRGTQNPIGIGASGSPAVVTAVVATVAVLTAAGLVAAATRYRSAAHVQRLQMRECMLAAFATFTGFVLISVFAPYEGLYLIAYSLVPLAVGLAMLRYRLYDVDVIIRRTLVYAVLVVCLAVVYTGGIAAAGALLRGVAGASSAFAVSVSTLAAAAAFQPARARIQRMVDRRFARAAYDPRTVVDDFSVRLREEIDLDVLAENLLGTVRGTVRPRTASVWLRPVTIPERPPGRTVP